MVEVGTVFRAREEGESKLSVVVMLQFGALLLDKLLGGRVPMRFLSFALVGLFGVLVDLVVLVILLQFHVAFAPAQTVATIVSMVANFWLNNVITYRDQQLRGRAALARAVRVHAGVRRGGGGEYRRGAGALYQWGCFAVACGRGGGGDRGGLELCHVGDTGLGAAASAVSSVGGGRKQFFFEKKNQKIFGSFGPGLRRGLALRSALGAVEKIQRVERKDRDGTPRRGAVTMNGEAASREFCSAPS